MKGKSLFYVCLLALLYASACTNSSPPESSDDDNTLTVEDTISLNTFNNWTRNWEMFGQDYTDSVLTKYFTMPIIDLKEVTNEQADAARFYLGLDTSVTPYYPHILLVGVDSSGKNLIDYNNGLYVYDVSSPCPPACIR